MYRARGRRVERRRHREARADGAAQHAHAADGRTHRGEKGGDGDQNAAAIEDLVDGKPGPYRDIVLFNAAASLIVAGKAFDLKDGVAQAARSIDDGAARAALDKMVDITNSGGSGTAGNSIITGAALDDIDAS